MANEVLAPHIESAARSAGLTVLSVEDGENPSGVATYRYTLALASEPNKTQVLELSKSFDAAQAVAADGLRAYLAESAQRLRNPRPDCYYTLHGVPLSFGQFAWPFHESSSGADTSLVHGEIRLQDGNESVLHAKVAASMTVTFREVLAQPEQPFAESAIYNAVRKILDQGQLELVKSGNRQPVPLTTRYYSTKQKRFIFNETTPEQRKNFLAGKVYWLSGVLGSGAPVWLADPRDAQYLDTHAQDLASAAKGLEADGLIQMNGEFGSPTHALMARRASYQEQLSSALQFIKPSFNEEMRAGMTNM